MAAANPFPLPPRRSVLGRAEDVGRIKLPFEINGRPERGSLSP
jgi:hypothetical protein